MIFWLLAFFIQFILKECSKLLMLNINLSFVFLVLNKSARSGAGAGLPKQHCAFNANSSFAQRMHARHRKCATRFHDFMFHRFITRLWIFLVWMDDLQVLGIFLKAVENETAVCELFCPNFPLKCNRWRLNKVSSFGRLWNSLSVRCLALTCHQVLDLDLDLDQIGKIRCPKN